LPLFRLLESQTDVVIHREVGQSALKEVAIVMVNLKEVLKDKDKIFSKAWVYLLEAHPPALPPTPVTSSMSFGGNIRQ
jgi:hypothetical protein